MKFSVVIPTYNRSFFLDELLSNLLKQTFTDFEILVCDDGSTDDTKQIVESYQTKSNKVYYFFEDNWGGPAKPRNIGIQQAKGEWICFLDSDDLWTQNKLFEISKVITHDVDVIYHLFSTNYSKSSVIGKYKKSNLYSLHEDLLVNGNKIVNSSLVVRRSKLVAINGLSEDKKLVGVEDYHLCIRLALAGCKFRFVNKVLGLYRLNDSNISADYLKQVDKVEYMQEQFKSNVSQVIHLKMKSLIAYMRASHYRKGLRARRLFLEAIKYGSFDIKIKSMYKFCFSYL